MPRLTLEREGIVLDLDALTRSPEGAQAVAGITGFGLPPVTVQWSDGAGDGSTYRGRRVNARPIDLPLTYLAGSRAALRSMVRDLARVLDGEAILRITEDDGTSQYVRVRRTGGGDFLQGTDTDGRGWLKTIVTLQAGDPFWTSSVTRSALYKGAEIPSSITIENDGTADAWPTWTISGPGLNWKATSPTGEVLHYVDFVPYGTTITIDTKRGTVTDQDGRNRYASLGPSPRFFSLPPGESQVEISFDRSSLAFWAFMSAGRSNYVTNPTLSTGSSGYVFGEGWSRSDEGDLRHAASRVDVLSSTDSYVVEHALAETALLLHVPDLRGSGAYDRGGATLQVRARVSSAFDPASQIAPSRTDGLLASGRADYPPRWELRRDRVDGPLISSGVLPYGDAEISQTVNWSTGEAFLIVYPGASAWPLTIGPGFLRGATVRTSPVTADQFFIGEPGSYFDGDTSDDEVESYAWTGTPHASASRALRQDSNPENARVGFSFPLREWLVV